MRLGNKFYVKNRDREGGGQVVEPVENTDFGYFVLSPAHDPAALLALASYAEHCEGELALDIKRWVLALKTKAEQGELQLGQVGALNAKRLLQDRALHEHDPETFQGVMDLSLQLKEGSTWPNPFYLLPALYQEKT